MSRQGHSLNILAMATVAPKIFSVILVQVCAKICKSSQQLKKHLRNHIAEEDKPLQCDQCEKRFLEKQKLASHRMSMHVKARPYSCRYGCGGMDYNDRSNRDAHERKKHGCVYTLNNMVPVGTQL